MKLIEKYLKNPCETLSIPYWKIKNISTPPNMLIIHQKEFSKHDYSGYIDEPYFRLYHSLEQIKETTYDEFIIKTALREDIPLFVDIINRSYPDLTVSYEQLVGYTETNVYDSNLWVLVIDKVNSNITCMTALLIP